MRALSLAILLQVSLAAAAADPGPRNLLKNASLTGGLDSWTLVPRAKGIALAAEVDPNVFYARDKAALRLATEPGVRGLVRQSGLPRTAAKKYLFVVWVRCRDLEPDWIIRVGVEQCKNGRAVRTLQNHHVAHLRDMDWTPVRLEAALPDDAEQAGVYAGLWFKDGVKPAGGGKVWFADMSLVPLEPQPPRAPSTPTLGGVAIDGIYPCGERGLFAPGEPIEVELACKNTRKEAVPLAVALAASDFAGRPSGGKQFQLRLPPGAAWRERLQLPAPAVRGFFKVQGHLEIEGRKVELATSVCVVPKPAQLDPYFVADVNGQDMQMVPAMQWIGVAGRKVGAPYFGMPEDKRRHMDEYWQRLIASPVLSPYWNSSLNLIGNVSLGPPPKWFLPVIAERRRQGLFPFPDEYFQEFGDFVEAGARALRSKVKLWVLSEEIDGTITLPDLPGGSQQAEIRRYVLVSRVAYERLKRVDPQCTVIGLAVSGDFNQTPRYSLVRRLLPDLKDFTDVIGPDLYTDSWNWCREPSLGPEVGQMREKLLDTVALQATLGKSPNIAISERGYGLPYHLAPDDPLEKRLADMTARSLVIGKSVPEVLFFALHMMVSGASWRAHSGATSDDVSPLLDMALWKGHYDGGGKLWYRPRSAVAAYATVARLLAGSRGAIEILPRPDPFIYVFQWPQQSVAVLWTNTVDSKSLRLELPCSAEVVDLMGNAQSLPFGLRTLPVTTSPQFLKAGIPPPRLAEILRKASSQRP